MTTATLNIKAGATLQLLIAVKDASGAPLDLTTVTCSSFVRTTFGSQVDTLILTQTGTPGQLSVSQATVTWPVGTLLCDLKIVTTSTGVVLKSDTFNIVVAAAVTTP
jgi:hypothetical protein